MDISIKINFGDGYHVSLTPHDARFLYSQLQQMFQEPALFDASRYETIARSIIASPYNKGSLDTQIDKSEGLEGSGVATHETELPEFDHDVACPCMRD